ncbi:MAG: hypothetical protein FD165_1157 [Gammaproteobacteria bacterium]|nr:MAG: hypothetical protein FD165_1157 [Gammaproteobacteria bacterium]TND07316.1 MAG: hypothetical protein FD120_54 [Gammaproteobacteria bacterium]
MIHSDRISYADFLFTYRKYNFYHDQNKHSQPINYAQSIILFFLLAYSTTKTL